MVARVGRGACGRLLPGCGHAMGFSMVGATVDIPPRAAARAHACLCLVPVRGPQADRQHGLCA